MRIGIIGAGVAGMSAAWDLVNAGHTVSIFEAGSEVGGLAAGFRDPAWDWTLEKFYHHWFETDHALLQLTEELGVRDKVFYPRPKTAYWINGTIYRSEISPSALFLPLPPLAKLRFAFAGAFIKLTPDWKSLERITAHQWFMRWMGQTAYDKFFRPLLIGKFGDRYQEVNMAWMWARVKARSLKLGTYEGGFQAFMETFAEKLRGRGVQIHLNTPVQGIAVRDNQPMLIIDEQEQSFDRIISTTSPGLLLKLTPGLRDTAYGAQVGALESIGAVCVIYALKQSVLTDGTYWLNLPATSADKSKTEFPFLALVEHTNWMDKRHYNGDVIVYCGDYVPPDHQWFKLSDEELATRFMTALPKANPNFKPDWVRKSWVFRAPYAQPLPGVNHRAKIPALKTPLQGVYWASMSQVYPWDRGTNYAVEIGRRVAEDILREM